VLYPYWVWPNTNIQNWSWRWIIGYHKLLVLIYLCSISSNRLNICTHWIRTPAIEEMEQESPRFGIPLYPLVRVARSLTIRARRFWFRIYSPQRRRLLLAGNGHSSGFMATCKVSYSRCQCKYSETGIISLVVKLPRRSTLGTRQRNCPQRKMTAFEFCGED
jgi:hypothetical protein